MTEHITQDPIRWLHLSDFHVGMDDYAQRKLFQEILLHFKKNKEQNFISDLVFITGDVANKGESNEYETFVSDFLEPLKKLIGEDATEKIFFVPGNHDVLRDTHRFFDRNEICQLDKEIFDPSLRGLSDRQQLLPRFSNYTSTRDIIPCGWLDTENGCYIRKIKIKGVQLGIVGINTAWLSKDKYDRHNLSPGINILDDALNQLDGCCLKIVLGHHPIDWFHDEHLPKIRSIFGRNHVVYLHGHLHSARVSPEDGAGYGFMCVQSGAAFQTRRNDLWVNGLLWGELDLSKEMLRLQPRVWIHQEWKLSSDLPESRKIAGSDWWAFLLPKATQQIYEDKIASSLAERPVRYPVGWQLIDISFLERHRKELNRANALRFFDGAIPDWHSALSLTIPRCEIVERVSQRLLKYMRPDRPQIVTLLGPAGEGKSTILMQAVDAILQKNRNVKVLWRTDEGVKLNPNELLQLPRTEFPWVLVSDVADNFVKDLYSACQKLKQARRGDIRFLLACRDTDWKASGAEMLEWITCAELQREMVSGLSRGDAKAIIETWASFGDEAVGKLSGLDLGEATKRLYYAARYESTIKGGSLLGALLKMRYGDDLKEHVKDLMDRLSEREIPGGGNLLSAFAYIAAMHAEGLEFLSRQVLAEALGCSPEKINDMVLAPLGKEAAISTDGVSILTRHREISRAALSLLVDVFHIDVDTLYFDLVKSADKIRSRGEFVPNLVRWKFGIADHFSATRRKDLAIRIGELLLEQNPGNIPLRVHFSSLYREAHSSGQATKLFRNAQIDMRSSRGARGAMNEWGLSEFFTGNHALGAILMAYALSDQITPQPDNNTAKISLNCLCLSFDKLFDKYNEVAFQKGYIAAARLGLTLYLDERTRTSFLKYINKNKEDVSVNEEADIDHALYDFQAAVKKTQEYINEDDNLLIGEKKLSTIGTFNKLKSLLINALKRPKND